TFKYLWPWVGHIAPLHSQQAFHGQGLLDHMGAQRALTCAWVYAKQSFGTINVRGDRNRTGAKYCLNNQFQAKTGLGITVTLCSSITHSAQQGVYVARRCLWAKQGQHMNTTLRGNLHTG